MDWQFWRLVTIAQGVSVLLMAIFYFAVAQTSKTPAIKLWLKAWCANFLALLIVTIYWSLGGEVFGALGTGGYIFLKANFVFLQLFGIWSIANHPAPLQLRRVVYTLAAIALVSAVLTYQYTFYYATFIQGAITISVFIYSAYFLYKHPVPRGTWLAVSLLSRAVVGVLIVFGNLLIWQKSPLVELWHIGDWISVSSTLDAATEWAIGMASLLVAHEITSRKLTFSNTQLQEAQRNLRFLANHDQLTGLLNRNSLADILEESRSQGASIAFFDIDNFKLLNDRHGHDIGDTCLKRFTEAMRAEFSHSEHLIRYAGDEFLVVAQSPPETLLLQADKVRQRLATLQEGLPDIQFSCGAVHIAAKSDPALALREADQAMYANKAKRRIAQLSG